MVAFFVAACVAVYVYARLDSPDTLAACFDSPEKRGFLLALFLSLLLAAAVIGLYAIPIIFAWRFCFERRHSVVPGVVLVLLGSWLGLRVVRSVLSSHPIVRKAAVYSKLSIATFLLFGVSFFAISGLNRFASEQQELRRATAAAKEMELSVEREGISSVKLNAERERLRGALGEGNSISQPPATTIKRKLRNDRKLYDYVQKLAEDRTSKSLMMISLEDPRVVITCLPSASSDREGSAPQASYRRLSWESGRSAESFVL